MAKLINPNLKQLTKGLKNSECSGVVLEGGSRSGKTWACLFFLIYICSKVETNCTIIILKETYNSFKTTIFADINRIFPLFGLQSPCEHVKELHSFKLFGSTIHFVGADKSSKAHGVGSDYVWVNEAVHVQQKVFNQYKQRCRKFWWMDYNPEFSKHYIYDEIIPRLDVSYLKTTMLDNPHISKAEKKEIELYNPNVQSNIDQGTADEYMYNVYALGLRVSPVGAIFKNWKIVKEFPEEIRGTSPNVGYWLDFGFVNDPCAIGGLWKYKGEYYLDEYCYETDLINVIDNDNPQQRSIQHVLQEQGISTSELIVADSAEQKSIRELRLKNYPVVPISKPRIIERINKVKSFKINILSSAKNIIAERDSYKWKDNKLTGGLTNEPVDKDNHHCDGIGYIFWYASLKGLI